MKQHQYERLADMLVKAMEHEAEVLVESLFVGDRPAFNVKLNEYEQYQRYADPMSRLQDEERVLAIEGPDGLAKYKAQMAKVMQRAADAGLPISGGEFGGESI